MLLIGDAAHTMSPAGAIGVNVAIATAAVAAQEHLPAPRATGPSRRGPAQVQRLREDDVRTLHRLQLGAQRVLLGKTSANPVVRWLVPRVLPLFLRSPLLPRMQRRHLLRRAAAAARPGVQLPGACYARAMTTPSPIDVDLYSDTVTRPTAEMRRFMCDAEVGDEQKYEDPTVNLLQEMVADLLGKEAAVFLPSGTMCNEIALRVHCRPGEEMLAHRTAHPIHFETGGPGALAGVNVRPLDGPRGQFDEAALEERHPPRLPLLPAQPARVGRADQQPRRRLDLAAGPRRGGDRRGAPPPAWPPTWTAPG